MSEFYIKKRYNSHWQIFSKGTHRKLTVCYRYAYARRILKALAGPKYKCINVDHPQRSPGRPVEGLTLGKNYAIVDDNDGIYARVLDDSGTLNTYHRIRFEPYE